MTAQPPWSWPVRRRFDLIILDLMMPGARPAARPACRSGSFPTCPSSCSPPRSEDADKLMGFACGADDYVTKPFNILELKARIRALLRRASGQSRPAAQPDPELLTVGDLTLDTRRAGGHPGRQGHRPHRQGVRSGGAADAQSPAGIQPRTPDGSWCGATPTPGTIARWMSTSAACGRSWSSVPAEPRLYHHQVGSGLLF